MSSSSIPPSSEHTRKLLKWDAAHLWHPFTQAQTTPAPLLVDKAQGLRLELSDGRVLLDMISSWWVNLHGHAHPKIAAAIAEQAHKLEQVIFAGFTHAPAIELGQKLTELLPKPINRVFYSDNGSTAIEVALKMALQYWANRGETRRHLFALEGGYHGDTFGAMSAGQSSGFYAPFQELLFEVQTVPCPHTFHDDPHITDKETQALQTLDVLLDQYGAQTAALILEPLLQGASGMRVYRASFLAEVIRRVRAHGILVIFDEVLTGFFRTGKLWAADYLNAEQHSQQGTEQHSQQGEDITEDLAPDLICLSKGITGGFLPLSVTACREELYTEFLGNHFDRAFAHGHSYTANPLACAAALASLELLLSPETQQQLSHIQTWHAKAAQDWAAHPALKCVRQQGTMLATELASAEPVSESLSDTSNAEYGSTKSLSLRNFFEERGLLMRPLGQVCYLLPPYCVQHDELTKAYNAVLEIADRVHQTDQTT